MKELHEADENADALRKKQIEDDCAMAENLQASTWAQRAHDGVQRKKVMKQGTLNLSMNLPWAVDYSKKIVVSTHLRDAVSWDDEAPDWSSCA
jgi:hypothetical protein